MELSFAHEQSQRALKQRNLLAIACLVLCILCFALATMASSRDREVILQPVIPKQMAISSSGVSKDYLEAVTRDVAQLALNWTCNGFVPVTYLIKPPWLRRRAG